MDYLLIARFQLCVQILNLEASKKKNQMLTWSRVSYKRDDSILCSDQDCLGFQLGVRDSRVSGF